MLTASQPTPKPAPSSIPGPENWPGVSESIAEADRLLRQGEPSGAENILRQALEFAPMEGRAWHLLGKVLQAGGRHVEALDCFSRAESCYGRGRDGPEPPASVRLARLLWAQGEKEEARAMLAILAPRHPDDERLRQLRDEWTQREGRGI